MLRIVGVALTLIGLAAAVAGWIWNALWPHPDGNIGAGMLVVLGLPVAGIGIVLLIIGMIAARRAP